MNPEVPEIPPLPKLGQGAASLPPAVTLPPNASCLIVVELLQFGIAVCTFSVESKVKAAVELLASNPVLLQNPECLGEFMKALVEPAMQQVPTPLRPPSREQERDDEPRAVAARKQFWSKFKRSAPSTGEDASDLLKAPTLTLGGDDVGEVSLSSKAAEPGPAAATAPASGVGVAVAPASVVAVEASPAPAVPCVERASPPALVVAPPPDPTAATPPKPMMVAPPDTVVAPVPAPPPSPPPTMVAATSPESMVAPAPAKAPSPPHTVVATTPEPMVAPAHASPAPLTTPAPHTICPSVAPVPAKAVSWAPVVTVMAAAPPDRGAEPSGSQLALEVAPATASQEAGIQAQVDAIRSRVMKMDNFQIETAYEEAANHPKFQTFTEEEGINPVEFGRIDEIEELVHFHSWLIEDGPPADLQTSPVDAAAAGGVPAKTENAPIQSEVRTTQADLVPPQPSQPEVHRNPVDSTVETALKRLQTVDLQDGQRPPQFLSSMGNVEVPCQTLVWMMVGGVKSPVPLPLSPEQCVGAGLELVNPPHQQQGDQQSTVATAPSTAVQSSGEARQAEGEGNASSEPPQARYLLNLLWTFCLCK